MKSFIERSNQADPYRKRLAERLVGWLNTRLLRYVLRRTERDVGPVEMPGPSEVPAATPFGEAPAPRADLYKLTSSYQWHVERLRTLRNIGAPAEVVRASEESLTEAYELLEAALDRRGT